jgi:hypothetical protein
MAACGLRSQERQLTITGMIRMIVIMFGSSLAMRKYALVWSDKLATKASDEMKTPTSSMSRRHYVTKSCSW